MANTVKEPHLHVREGRASDFSIFFFLFGCEMRGDVAGFESKGVAGPKGSLVSFWFLMKKIYLAGPLESREMISRPIS